MKLKTYFVLFISLLIIISGCKDKGTNPPVDEKPPGYQEDIPWPSLADSPWPMSQGDPQNTGRTKAIGPSNLNVVWTFDAPYGLASGPVIGQNGNLYFGVDHALYDNFYSLTPLNDSLNWNTKTGDGVRLASGIIINKSYTIYVNSGNFV